MTTEPKITVLGVVTLEPGQALAFDIPLNASAEEIAAGLAAAEEAKAAAALAETKRLREIFLRDERADG
jgi:hypothetical protein